ncbi:lipoate--protein ligase family protein [Methanooceanicella nereidis]|nr:lipoate--protein ligase family protein [Methanocella sp. CWC-04]
MAIDEAISGSISKKASSPTIRFYKWNPSAVSIGCFQGMNDEVDTGTCERLGIEYVRRRTGGGAVYHDSEGEITYSVICPEEYFSKDIGMSYRQICSYIVSALSDIGIGSEFRPINDVIVNGKKISGSAQTRRNGVITQHGTILYKADRDTMFSVLKPSGLKLSDKPVKSFKDGITSVSEICDVTGQELYYALLHRFTEEKEHYFGRLNEEEIQRVNELISKYVSRSWNFSR